MYFWRRIVKRRLQFRDEVVGKANGLHTMIMGLSLIGELMPVNLKSMTVIVDSCVEVFILRLLSILQLLPWYKIFVVRHARDLQVSVEENFGGECLLIVTSRIFIKHSNLLIRFRHQDRLIVL